MRGRPSSLAICALVALMPAFAHADDEPVPIRAGLTKDSNTIEATLDITATFTEAFRREVSGGLTSRVVIELLLESAGGVEIASALRHCELRLDVWDDVVYSRIRDGSRVARKKYLLIDDALKACGRIEDVPIADGTLLTRKSGYRLRVTVALNPVSPELLESSREFMSNPRGAGPGRPRGFLGAVAKLFPSDPARGREVFMFLSPPLDRPD